MQIFSKLLKYIGWIVLNKNKYNIPAAIDLDSNLKSFRSN